jgi:hypothetical protein
LIKKEFNDKIELNLVTKNNIKEIKEISFNVELKDIDKKVKIKYNKDSLKLKLC